MNRPAHDQPVYQGAPPANVTNVYVTPPRPTKRTNHVLHAILTVLTGGAWGIVWLVQVLRHRNV